MTKLGRNGACFCGSGKKYKKCCEGKQINGVSKHLDSLNKCLMVTLTGEPYQPTRIYYELFNISAVIQSLQKLKCIYYNRDLDKFEWVFDNESRNLKFSNPYSSIPKEKCPIVLGLIDIKRKGQLILDVRSFGRATVAIEFFDKHIKRSDAKVTDIAVVNRFFDAKEGTSSNFDVFFDSKKVFIHNSDEYLKKLNELADSIGLESALTLLDKHAFHEIEKLSVYFYDEGITGLNNLLILRQMLANEHWNGNTELTMYDIVKRYVAKAT